MSPNVATAVKATGVATGVAIVVRVAMAAADDKSLSTGHSAEITSPEVDHDPRAFSFLSDNARATQK